MIAFQETTDTGFGDRLRGIAWLLHLATRFSEHEILYNDDHAVRNADSRWSSFPARMTDLIRIEGVSFAYHPLPLPPAAHSVVYDSLVDHDRETRLGFPHMRRLRPRDDAVAERVRELGVDRSCLGFHVRHTDNMGTQSHHCEGHVERRSLHSIGCLARRHRTRRLFLAADNERSLRRWSRIFEVTGHDVRTNSPSYDEGRLRQTSTHDMLVDFFALAACRRIARAVPSEFSRFAAWAGGRRLRYEELV